MREIVGRSVVAIALFLGLSGFFAVNSPVYAAACTDWNCTFYRDPQTGNTSQYCYGTPTGCVSAGGCSSQGCAGVSCEAGFYACNNGCCPIGGGGGQCGDTYSCPTPSNPGKICYISCGGGGEACRNARVDCPAGTVRTSTVVGTMCEKVNGEGICGGIGSAQRSFSDEQNCCRFYYPPDECEEKCQNGRCWEVCYEQPGWCTNALIRTYSCVSTCNATAPTNVSVTQGSSTTVANLSWTSGINGVSQRLWVDEDLSEVNAGCPTPYDCVVNTTLASSTNSYIVTGLAPSTTYYFNILTYKDNTCARGTVVSYATISFDYAKTRLYKT